MLYMLRYGRIAQLCEVICPPVPLHSGNEQCIKRALHCGKRSRTNRIEQGCSHAAHGSGRFLGFFSGPCAAPDNGTDHFHVKLFGEHWSRRDNEKGEESVHFLRGRQNKSAIGLKNVRRLLKRPKCWPELDGAYWMQAELKRSYDAEVSATTSYSPK